jgi:diaminohydroxyphosphoribosylaminopyrimidine deaminase/5-amino-6-(5-phosphoribosylamino)uracil reductase
MNKDFLNKAADLAIKTDPHFVAPNPRVACVVVKNGQVITQAVHQEFGQNHAEINALKDLKTDLTNAKIFITLEPCDYFLGKKTPSCTDFLIKKFRNIAGVKIFVGALDPQFNGKNLKKINKAGIFCEYLKNKKCEEVNPFLSNWVKKKTPFLRLKMAMSLDGKITNSEKWISNKISRQLVHQARANFSAILTTTETILKDNPSLDVRLSENKKSFSNPPILIFGKRKIPQTAKIFQIKNRKIHFFTGDNLLEDFIKIKKLNIDSIFTECGAKMATSLLKANLVNVIECFVAPQVFGKGQNVFTDEFNISKDFNLQTMENLEQDLHLVFRGLCKTLRHKKY